MPNRVLFPLPDGPMSAINKETLIVCFLSSDPKVRAYESDVLRELEEKKLGLMRLIAGQSVPRDLVQTQDSAIEYQGIDELDDDNFRVRQSASLRLNSLPGVSCAWTASIAQLFDSE